MEFHVSNASHLLLIQKEIQKTLIDCSRHDLFLTKNKIRQAKGLTDVLKIVELSSTTLGSNQIDLLKGDRILEFLLTNAIFYQ